MKKLLTPILALVSALTLSAVARADVLVSPVEIAVDLVEHNIAWILVAAAVVATAAALLRLRKKK